MGLEPRLGAGVGTHFSGAVAGCGEGRGVKGGHSSCGHVDVRGTAHQCGEPVKDPRGVSVVPTSQFLLGFPVSSAFLFSVLFFLLPSLSLNLGFCWSLLKNIRVATLGSNAGSSNWSLMSTWPLGKTESHSLVTWLKKKKK